MSSFRKRQKTLKRAHKERSQPHNRRHLGLLEKHKDHVLRARDYEKKQKQLKLLHEKARNRNPDEFYYKMVKTSLQDGKHVLPQEKEHYGLEELQLMKTQDEKYVRMKLATEVHKVEKLQSCLHLTRHQPSNCHTIFVDTPEEVEEKANQLKIKTKPHQPVGVSTSNDHTSTSSMYKELRQRRHRCKELQRVCSKMKTQKDLLGKGQRIKIKGDECTPSTYKWKKERKR